MRGRPASGGGLGFDGPDLSVRLAGDRILTADGCSLGVLACGDVDLLAVEPWRREAAIGALEEFLRGLCAELIFTIRIRRLRQEGVPDSHAGRLTAALEAHWRLRLETEQVFHNHVAAAIRHADGEVVEGELGRLATCLETAGVPARRLGGRRLADHLGDIGLGARPLAWHDRPGGARLGGRLVRTAVLDRLPGGGVDAGWLAALARCAAECDVAIRLSPTPDRRATGLLNRRMRELGAHQILETERGMVPDAGVESGLQAARRLSDRLARNAGRPMRLWLTAAALGDDPESLKRSWGRLQAAFGASLVAPRPGHFEHLGGVLAAWGLGPPVGPGKLVDSHAAASCVPWLQTTIADPDGYRIGRMADSGLPVRLSPFDERHHANANIGIFAASGQGKSFLIGTLLIEARRHGTEAIVIDPEGEYRELVESLGGEWLDLVTQASINPFDLGDDGGAAVAVVEVCSVLCDGIDEVERAAVEAAARRAQAEARERGDRPRLRQCLGPLEESGPRVATVLRRFLDGPLSGFLDRPTVPTWTHPLVAVGSREVPEELVPVTTLLLGGMLWELVRRVPRRRHIILDEAGMLTSHPALRRLLSQLARRCRKYGSSLVVATQNVQDLLRSEEGTVVASNCAVVLCGGHRAVEVAAMERAFGLTETQHRRLERAPRGEFLLIAGERRGMIQVDVPTLYRQMICGGGSAWEAAAPAAARVAREVGSGSGTP
ncbi:MAG: DUF87 domain-containing protein [Candidatus Dormibacteria bacterium]